MNQFLERQRQLSGDNAAVQRGQLSVEISQGSIALDQLHLQVEAEQSSFGLARPEHEKISTAERKCDALRLDSKIHSDGAKFGLLKARGRIAFLSANVRRCSRRSRITRRRLSGATQDSRAD